MNVVVHRRDAEYAKEINPMPSEKSNDWKAKKIPSASFASLR
jgi:hypothetical protein